jgi:membrane-associated phospholipid phosphatase
LAYAYPEDAQLFLDKAEEAAQSRVLAGAHFPSDVAAGLALGRAVAQQMIARADQDGSSATWDGVMPTEPGHWTGENPVDPNAAHWLPWVLASPDEFRPRPPPAYDSAELAAELQETVSFTRTWQTNQKALYWQTFDGIYATWYDFATLRLFEAGLDANPPRAARIYALLGIAHNDALIACWDAKYTYWAIRPHQLDPTFVPLFPVPNHPSYPSAHSCLSGAMAEVLAYEFPAAAEAIHARAVEAGESRIWGGLHFRSDITAGLAIGEALGQKVIEHAQQDGSMASQ